ncbi:MAG: molybdopterin-dependent oxidoreductase, partial [Dehalococcoidia bacterium]|nr:molybdopterin-dependent oxidoreductase [Dehalococcoidia bacterium]
MAVKRISRRTFIKIGSAGVGVAALGATAGALTQAQELIPGGRTVSRTTGSPRRAVPSVCLQCSARCGILGFIEEGQLVKIEGNPRDPNNQGRICAKGQAGLNHLYNPDRILYPMRRAGPRGANVWQRIPWDVAIQEVAAHLAEIRHSGNSDHLLLMAGLFEGTQALVRRFAQVFGTSRFCQESDLYQSNKTVAQQLTWGADLELNDVARSSYILNFGANPYESHTLFIPFIQRLIEGRMRSARLVTLDPRVSGTAARSDEWLPIKPGTDGIVALAMANVIMQKRLYDRGFLEKWTNVTPERLAQHLSSYTPDMAGDLSGLPPSSIERIAVEFATNKPATTLSGGGATLNAHGVQTERAIALLNAMTGNVDVPGGYCLPRTYQLPEPDPQPPEVGSPLSPVQSSRLFAEVKEGKIKSDALMTYMANPIFSYPDPQLTAQVISDPNLIPFYVAVDTYITETSVMADVILPAATYLESWDIQSTPSYTLVPQVSLMQPLVKPLGESLAFQDICFEIARRIGGGMEKYFDFGSVEGYVSAIVSKIPGLDQAGGLKYLKENGRWHDPQAQASYRTYEGKGFGTPSGKFEISSKAVEDKGLSPLPDFSISPPNQGNKGEGLVLVTFQWNVHTHGRTAPCMWLSEIVHDNPLWIHPETAQALGIRKGDKVQVTSELGSL